MMQLHDAHKTGYPMRSTSKANRNNESVTSAEATIDPARIHSLTRPNVVSVGTIVWLSSELMFFAGLFAMYFSIRAATIQDEHSIWVEGTHHLKVPYALVFTIILVLSSVTCQLGVFAAEKGDVYRLRAWFTLTFFLGLIFVLGQVNEYRVLVSEDLTISTNGYWSMFFLTTGFHGLHVIGGLVAFIYFLIRSTMGKFTPAQATASIVVSFYWHFVDVVWIALFITIYFVK